MYFFNRFYTFSTLTFFLLLEFGLETMFLFFPGLGRTFGGLDFVVVVVVVVVVDEDDMLLELTCIRVRGSERGGGEQEALDSRSLITITLVALAQGLVVIEAVFENELSFLRIPFNCFCFCCCCCCCCCLLCSMQANCCCCCCRFCPIAPSTSSRSFSEHAIESRQFSRRPELSSCSLGPGGRDFPKGSK